MSKTASRESPPSHFTELPMVGTKTAETLSDTLDIDQTDVRGLARAFFGTKGQEVADVVSDAEALVRPLLQAGRGLSDGAFDVQIDAPTVLEVMAFVRTFRVNPGFLRSDSSVTSQTPNKYAIPPAAIDWEQGVIADRFDVAASVYSREAARSTHHIDLYSTDTEPEYLTQNPYDWVAYNANGVRSLVGYDYVETIGNLCGCDFLDEDSFEFIRIHGTEDDFFVAFSGPRWTTDIAVAPKILDD